MALKTILFSFSLVLNGFSFSLHALSQDEHYSVVPKVITSIPPFYLLTCAIMDGIGKPTLLVKPGASPHDYHLKPSEMQKLNEAELIIWGGPELETFLTSPIKKLSQHAKIKILELAQTKGLHFLPIRSESIHEFHAEHHHSHSTHTHAESSNQDMHFWLNPSHSLLLAENIAKTLSLIDPNHAKQYSSNLEIFKKKMQAADKNILLKLKPIQQISYLVFHDAYRYFEHYYGLQGIGAITLHPELPLSTKRLLIIQQRLRTENIRCIFTEPQFPDKMVKILIQGTEIGTTSLDPMGASYLGDQDGYIKMLEGLSNSFASCLKQNAALN